MRSERANVFATLYLTIVFVLAKTIALKSKQKGSIEKIDEVCPESYFPCVKDPICIQQISNCDGKIDCPDSSDEENCYDNPLDEYFDSLVSKKLSAMHDDESKDCSLPYNGTCICERRDIFCHMRGLTKVPDGIPKVKIDILDFTHNNFEILNENVFENLHEIQIERLLCPRR